ncbi:MAG TPA: alpha/beta hydrolase-fold protein [Phnomibacter sp.]|nr:alpha/beta hydrolase-fold protein [Phnomibacter sp.]
MSTAMSTEQEIQLEHYRVHTQLFNSEYLDREIKVDVYMPVAFEPHTQASVLIVNDGQDLPKMPFTSILEDLYGKGEICPLIVVGLHCNDDRRLEYGTADLLDFLNRGSRAKYHRKFVLQELIPYLLKEYQMAGLQNIGYAGFSLGGLSAIDVAWKHPEIFNIVGVFSGSLWWRLKDLDDGYLEAEDRVMHKLIREGNYAANLKFFFETGTKDETMDRNNNGIIDSIDDTMSLIDELVTKGYDREKDIQYLELPDGKHDVATWARAFPAFLKWGWGEKTKE